MSFEVLQSLHLTVSFFLSGWKTQKQRRSSYKPLLDFMWEMKILHSVSPLPCFLLVHFKSQKTCLYEASLLIGDSILYNTMQGALLVLSGAYLKPQVLLLYQQLSDCRPYYKRRKWSGQVMSAICWCYGRTAAIERTQHLQEIPVTQELQLWNQKVLHRYRCT